jgi:phenylalanyl-tRNA synthetase beta chain
MPPIINSEATRVHGGTTELFIDVTGLSDRLVSKTLTVTATSLLELAAGAELESVEVRYPTGAVTTPELAPERVSVEARRVADLIGVELGRDDVARLLRRMGHGAAKGKGDGELVVEVPAYRNDVMHEVDLVEDVAIAYGYDAVPRTLVQTLTVGEARPIEDLSALARRVLSGLGLLEMKTLPLTSPEATYDALGLGRADDGVLLANPTSVEQSMLRTSLLPGLLGALQGNVRRELPHRVFEVGDVTRLAPSGETGAEEHRVAAVALVGVRVGFADIWSIADALVRELGHSLVIRESDRITADLWIRGRAAKLSVSHGSGERALGVIGEVSPAVLERFGLRAPAALLELELGALPPPGS